MKMPLGYLDETALVESKRSRSWPVGTEVLKVLTLSDVPLPPTCFARTQHHSLLGDETAVHKEHNVSAKWYQFNDLTPLSHSGVLQHLTPTQLWEQVSNGPNAAQMYLGQNIFIDVVAAQTLMGNVYDFEDTQDDFFPEANGANNGEYVQNDDLKQYGTLMLAYASNVYTFKNGAHEHTCDAATTPGCIEGHATTEAIERDQIPRFFPAIGKCQQGDCWCAHSCRCCCPRLHTRLAHVWGDAHRAIYRPSSISIVTRWAPQRVLPCLRLDSVARFHVLPVHTRRCKTDPSTGNSQPVFENDPAFSYKVQTATTTVRTPVTDTQASIYEWRRSSEQDVILTVAFRGSESPTLQPLFDVIDAAENGNGSYYTPGESDLPAGCALKRHPTRLSGPAMIRNAMPLWLLASGSLCVAPGGCGDCGDWSHRGHTRGSSDCHFDA